MTSRGVGEGEMARGKTEIGRRFFTTSDVARYCEVSNDGVLKWIKGGKLRAFSTPGGHYRISAEDFRAFLARYEIPVHETFFPGAEPAGQLALVVDDEPAIREMVRRHLLQVRPGLRVEEASDGYEAGIKMGSLRPDLVVLDVMMPRVDGISLLRSIRGNPATRRSKVLAITGDPDKVESMIEAGADLCLTKPLQFELFRSEALRLLQEAARLRRPAGRPRADRLATLEP